MKVFLGKPKNKQVIRIRVDDYDLWNVDLTLAHIIVATLKAFRASERHGVPLVACEAVYGPTGQDAEDFTILKAQAWWNEQLDTMIEAFELHIAPGDIEDDWSPETERLKQEKIQVGIDLFAKYFKNLWD